MTLVMKFGGSSVANTEKLKKVASRIREKVQAGCKVVVVVSAPGDMTDDLIERAAQISSNPPDREMDMLLATGEQVSIALLSMAMHKLGIESVSLTGPQAGIQVDSNHTRGRITEIDPIKIQRELKKRPVVIVAGFQGANSKQDIATLGRGGSDLSAVALAASLQSNACEIYTDVKGIYTADPRIVPQARKLSEISYDEILELAGSGSQVMQARSIEVAKKYQVQLSVRSTFSQESGTKITEEVSKMEQVVVSGVASDKNQAKLSIVRVSDHPGIAARVFGELAKESINVDMIIQSAAKDGTNDISFTLAQTDLKKAFPLLETLSKELKAHPIHCQEEIAKVSIVGVGMKSHPGVAAKMFDVLAKAKINIEMISTSEIKIACIVSQSQCNQAVQLLHEAFNLETEPN